MRLWLRVATMAAACVAALVAGVSRERAVPAGATAAALALLLLRDRFAPSFLAADVRRDRRAIAAFAVFFSCLMLAALLMSTLR